jgi:hypothetical protein
MFCIITDTSRVGSSAGSAINVALRASRGINYLFAPVPSAHNWYLLCQFIEIYLIDSLTDQPPNIIRDTYTNLSARKYGVLSNNIYNSFKIPTG